MFFLYSSKDIAAAAVVAAAAATGGPKTKPQYYCRVTFSQMQNCGDQETTQVEQSRAEMQTSAGRESQQLKGQCADSPPTISENNKPFQHAPPPLPDVDVHPLLAHWPVPYRIRFRIVPVLLLPPLLLLTLRNKRILNCLCWNIENHQISRHHGDRSPPIDRQIHAPWSSYGIVATRRFALIQ